MGMALGWPDLEVFVPKEGWIHPLEKAGIFIELKANKGRLTDNQKTKFMENWKAIYAIYPSSKVSRYLGAQ